MNKSKKGKGNKSKIIQIPDDPRGGPEGAGGEADPAQQQKDGGPEEGEEEEEESTYCPIYQNSDQFSFITNDAYSKLEEGTAEVSQSEMDKIFQHVRPMRGRVGVLENPHGSVRLWQGSTAVICAVYGPSDVRMSKELPHRAAVDVLYRPKVTGSGNMSAMLAAGMMDPIIEERAIEQTVTSVLESVIHLEDHVQAGFNVILHEFENDGCLLSTCLNATCLALMNAGCSLRSLFAAVTLGVCGDKIVIDPCSSQIEEMKEASESDPFSLLTFVLTNNTTTSARSPFSPKILHVSTIGRVSPKTLSSCYKFITTNESITSEIFRFFSGVISEDLAKCFIGLLSAGDDLKDDDLKDRKVKKIKDEKEEMDEEEGDEEEQVEDEEDGEIISSDDTDL